MKERKFIRDVYKYTCLTTGKLIDANKGGIALCNNQKCECSEVKKTLLKSA